MSAEDDPRYPTQLSAKLQDQIEGLIGETLAEVPEPYRMGLTLKMKAEAQTLVSALLTEVSDMYREGLTSQVALLTKENEELRERLNS
jgi:hypothetical protein